MQQKNSGFSIALVLIFLAIIAIIGTLGWVLYTKYIQKSDSSSGNSSWSFEGEKWEAAGTPPACPNPLQLQDPVDVSLASGVLYPGQTRGNNYKPHGGFRFDGKTNDAIKVKAPMDGTLVSGSRYIEQGENQYMLFFINPCGIAYRFDHLLTLSPSMQAAADTLPAAKENDSRSTNFSTPVEVKTGDEIATAVGFKTNQNVSVDFGVYDLRTQNEASKQSSFAAKHSQEKEQAYFGVCWFDLLPSATAIKALPPGDPQSGKTSDYCK